MSCEDVTSDLVAYHFGVADDDARGRVEAHLVECPECVRAFVALKRSIERSEDVPPPSAEGRARLRRAVAREVGAETGRATWGERAMAMALAACVVFVAGAMTRVLLVTPGWAPYALSTGR